MAQEPEAPVAGPAVAPVEPAVPAAPPAEGAVPAADPTFERLFGDASAAPGGAAAPSPEGPISFPPWLWVLAGVALMVLGVIRWIEQRRRAAEGTPALRVAGRVSLGRDGQLSLVEVVEPDGHRRRLLVGHGGGAPRLVAELESPGGAFEERLGAAERLAGALPVARATGPAAAPASAAAAAAPGPRPLSQRGDLIQEVLAERDAGVPLAVAGDPTTFVGGGAEGAAGGGPEGALEGAPEGEAPAYTFRGLLG